jgi:hypothetical protein
MVGGYSSHLSDLYMVNYRNRSNAEKLIRRVIRGSAAVPENVAFTLFAAKSDIRP